MQIVVQNSSGDNVDTITVSDNLFDAPMNQALVHQVAVAHMANARQGTSSTKTRGMVSGGGAKPWRQKHTGRARQGSRTAPHWRGGSVVFGPHPRDYSQKIPKKMNRGAIRCVLSEKNRLDKLIVLDGFNISSGKTREMVDLLSTLGVSSPVLLVTDLPQSDLILASRNIKRVTTLPAAQINVLDLLNHDRLVITVDAIRKAEALWSLDGVAGDATGADNVKEGIS